MNMTKLYSFIFSFLLFLPVVSEDKKISTNEHEVNFYTGVFDFSDDGKRAQLYGFEHQNESLFRETKIGRLSPVTGAFITADSATYFYTGIQAHYDYGKIDFTPNKYGLFSAETKRNLITNSAEYYNLSYEYTNDCLRAGLVYRREFYNDSELEPEDSLMFKITLTPFGNINSPSFN